MPRSSVKTAFRALTALHDAYSAVHTAQGLSEFFSKQSRVPPSILSFTLSTERVQHARHGKLRVHSYETMWMHCPRQCLVPASILKRQYRRGDGPCVLKPARESQRLYWGALLWQFMVGLCEWQDRGDRRYSNLILAQCPSSRGLVVNIEQKIKNVDIHYRNLDSQ